MRTGIERGLINGQLFRITLHIDFLYTTGYLWAPVVRTLLTASTEGVGARGTAHQASANASATGPNKISLSGIDKVTQCNERIKELISSRE